MDHQYMLNYFKGILALNDILKKGNDIIIEYDFKHPKLLELKNKYKLESFIKESDFLTALTILNFLAPNLKHESYYDNHIPCNSLDLMEYSFKKEEFGINCLNKSKVLEECLLSLGIVPQEELE